MSCLSCEALHTRYPEVPNRLWICLDEDCKDAGKCLWHEHRWKRDKPKHRWKEGVNPESKKTLLEKLEEATVNSCEPGNRCGVCKVCIYRLMREKNLDP